MSSTHGDTDEFEDYPTPFWCVHRFFEHVGHAFDDGPWLEPTAGAGSIIQAVKAMPKISPTRWDAIDIQEKHFQPLCKDAENVTIQDFLTYETKERYRLAISNPPFSLALPVIEKCLGMAETVAMLLRLNYMGSEDRHSFFRRNMPDLYILPNRPSFKVSKKTGKRGTDSIEYAWFVWGRQPTIYGTVQMLGLTPLEQRKVYGTSIPELGVTDVL